MASPSPIAAAERAVQNAVQALFRPFRLERWLVLGFVAMLDQCSHMARSSCQIRPPIGGDDESSAGMREAMRAAFAWLGDHPLAAAAIAAAFFSFVIGFTVVVLWLTCRGRFMYVDNVATGRADIRRPWTEHAGHAGSHFAWMLGIVLGTVMLLVCLTLPVIWGVVRLQRHGPQAGTIVLLAAAGLAFLALALGMSLFIVAMRDFVAPLQWFADLPCGPAIRLFGGLLRANVGLFALYVLLKAVFTMVVVVVTIAACCVTLCCAVLPFVQQVLLQPIFYFERRWSLEILKELGYAPPGTVPAPSDAAEPPAVVPPPSSEPDPEPGLPSF